MEVETSAVTAAAANLHALRQHVFKMSDYWQQPQRGPPQHSPGIQHSPISNSTQQQQHQQVQQLHSPLGQTQQQQQQQQQQTSVSQVQQTSNTGLGPTASPQQQMQQQQQHAMSMSQQTTQAAQHQSSPAPTTPSPQADHQSAIASSMAQSLHNLAQAQQTMSQASSPSLAVQAVQAAQALNQNLGQALTQALTQNMQQNLGQTLQHNLAQSLTPSLSPQQQQQLLNQPQNLSQASQNLQQNIQSQAQNLSQTLQQQTLSQQAQNLTQNLQQQAQNLQQQALNMASSIAQNGGLAVMNMSANQQQNSQNSMLSPGATSQDSHDASLTEKLVNELQSRASAAGLGGAGGAGGGGGMGTISERALEECWSTLQRFFSQIFMHKSAAMQMHARELGAGALTARPGGGVAGALASLGPIGVGPGGMIAGNEVKPHQCQQCLKSFSSNHQLVQHIRVHTGEKPYKCSYCDRRFKQLSHVQQHTRLHTGERPYKCHLPDCGRAFIQLSNLQQHLRNHDAQVERAKNRPFQCNICGKGFATESSLRTHTSKVSHCSKYPWQRLKELQQRVVFQQHATLIGGPNATSCPVCHKLFLSGEALMEHMKHTHKDPNASGVANFCAGTGLLNNNNNNNNNNMASPGPSGNKLSEMLRAGSQPGTAQQYHDEMQSQQQRMAVMAAAVASAGLQNSVSPNLSPVDMASLAAAMRMGNNGDMSGGAQGSTGPQQQGVQATGPEQTLRMHQAEALLRSQAEAALRLAVTQAAAAAASSAVGGDVRHHLGQHNGGSTSGMPGHHTNQQMSQQDTLPSDLGEALRLQEQRLEQALRLHGDPRALSFTLQHVVNQQNNQQP
ncbi:zinc finger protein datilografo isoform X15 [Lasioglossum baleicum]|uniref:zinc finger protein datilografo isoform X15 n=1 Tax=Lasioglossum baleicum TaxID=434251 RepID=UPI003FCC4BF0